MKKHVFFFLFVLAAPLFAEVTFPEHYDNYINDFAGILTDEYHSILHNSFENVQKQTGIQIVIVTIESLEDYGAALVPFQVYAANLFDNWGIGRKSSDNGILIFFSLLDREVRIEMGAGYAHRYDGKIQSIVDKKMLPFFRNSQYSRGIYEGSLAVINVVTKEVSWLRYHMWHIILSVLLVVCVAAGISCIKSGEKGWGFVFFAAVLGILLALFEISKKDEGYKGGKSGGGGGGGKW